MRSEFYLNKDATSDNPSNLVRLNSDIRKRRRSLKEVRFSKKAQSFQVKEDEIEIEFVETERPKIPIYESSGIEYMKGEKISWELSDKVEKIPTEIHSQAIVEESLFDTDESELSLDSEQEEVIAEFKKKKKSWQYFQVLETPCVEEI